MRPMRPWIHSNEHRPQRSNRKSLPTIIMPIHDSELRQMHLPIQHLIQLPESPLRPMQPKLCFSKRVLCGPANHLPMLDSSQLRRLLIQQLLLPVQQRLHSELIRHLHSHPVHQRPQLRFLQRQLRLPAMQFRVHSESGVHVPAKPTTFGIKHPDCPMHPHRHHLQCHQLRLLQIQLHLCRLLLGLRFLIFRVECMQPNM